VCVCGGGGEGARQWLLYPVGRLVEFGSLGEREVDLLAPVVVETRVAGEGDQERLVG